MAIFFFTFSITIPEKLEYFINKYAEHSHDKWSMEKVKSIFLLKQNQNFILFLFFKEFALDMVIFHNATSWHVGKI